LYLLILLFFIAIAIPFILLFNLGLKIISSTVNSFSRATNLSLLGVWLIALMGLAFAGIEYGAHSANKFSISKKHTLINEPLDTITIKMLAKDNFKAKKYSEEKSIFIDGVEKAYRTNIRLDIRESNTDVLYLKIHKKANAISIDKAKSFTDEMIYNFDKNDTNLLLNAYFLSDIKNRYKSQYIRITLFVPKGQVVYLDKTTKYFLSDVNNIQNIYDKNMIRHYYKMTGEGLNCIDCESDNDIEKEITKIEQVL